MYYLRGYDAVMETIKDLTEACNEGPVHSLEALRAGYIGFIRHVQTLAPLPHEKQPLYQFNTHVIRQLLKHYEGDDMLTDKKAEVVMADASGMKTALAVIERQLAELQVIDPHLYEVFHTVIHTLFYARSSQSGGGSVSSALGVIWCGHRKTWTGSDVVEFLVHELTHNLVFLDEYRYVHYVDLDLVADQRNWARSAILKCLRPMDKVFHSLVVAHEVLSWRRQVGEPTSPHVHPRSVDLIADALHTVDSIYRVVEHTPLVTARVLELTGQIERNLRIWSQPEVSEVLGV